MDALVGLRHCCACIHTKVKEKARERGGGVILGEGTKQCTLMSIQIHGKRSARGGARSAKFERLLLCVVGDKRKAWSGSCSACSQRTLI